MPVRGVWSACGDDTNVTAVDRSSVDGVIQNKRELALLKSNRGDSSAMDTSINERIAQLEEKLRFTR